MHMNYVCDSMDGSCKSERLRKDLICDLKIILNVIMFRFFLNMLATCRLVRAQIMHWEKAWRKGLLQLGDFWKSFLLLHMGVRFHSPLSPSFQGNRRADQRTANQTQLYIIFEHYFIQNASLSHTLHG